MEQRPWFGPPTAGTKSILVTLGQVARMFRRTCCSGAMTALSSSITVKTTRVGAEPHEGEEFANGE